MSSTAVTVHCVPPSKRQRLAAVNVSLNAEVVFATPTQLQRVSQQVDSSFSTFAAALNARLPLRGAATWVLQLAVRRHCPVWLTRLALRGWWFRP